MLWKLFAFIFLVALVGMVTASTDVDIERQEEEAYYDDDDDDDLLIIDDEQLPDEEGCSDGACPSPYAGYSADDNSNIIIENSCGLWLGPSPIKKQEQHGFGLGMFTGRPITKGSTVEGGSEILLPLYGPTVQDIYDTHPPLREYIWDQDNMPIAGVEYPQAGYTALFIPGLASVVPCTAVNYNLEWRGTGRTSTDSRESVVSNSQGVHRSMPHATAGSFAYRHNVSYVAVRDIAAGEELTVACSDDGYDGGAYYLSRYNANDHSVICLDQNLRVDDRSTIPAAAGRGLFAKQKQVAGSTLISTPLIPIHRDLLEMSKSDDNEEDDDDDDDEEHINSKQLMLNYCYGHPDSDLLLLPYGPLINSLNHAPHSSSSSKQANAVIRWHTIVDADTTAAGTPPTLDRRQEHHHPELLAMSAEQVAVTHGKGLMMDVVALRSIEAGEEILLDYGTAWQQAWDEHLANWKKNNDDDRGYVDAETYVQAHDGEAIRTVAEQREYPYPDNLETFCYYSMDDIEEETWTDDTIHDCFRPCRVLERSSYRTGDGGEANTFYYTVEFSPEDNQRVFDFCSVDADTIVTVVPGAAIRIVDRPYSTDVFLKYAFRHEIGVPNGFYPEAWMRKKLRRQPSFLADSGDEFKRKKSIKAIN